jgi:hypothetical protein
MGERPYQGRFSRDKVPVIIEKAQKLLQALYQRQRQKNLDGRHSAW